VKPGGAKFAGSNEVTTLRTDIDLAEIVVDATAPKSDKQGRYKGRIAA
jgi:hypothetical protein